MSGWGLLCGWAALGLFARAQAIWPVLGFALLATALRGRWEIGLRPLAGLTTALVGASLLLGDRLVRGSDSSHAAAGLAAAQCLFFLRRYQGKEEMAACFVSIALALLSTFGDPGNPQVVAVLLVAMIGSLRAMNVGSSWSATALLALGLSFPVGAGLAAAVRAGDEALGRLWASFSSALGGSGDNSFPFPVSSHLDTLVDRQKDSAVVLHYRSPKPPRYLVGMVYTVYADNTWTSKGGTEAVFYERGPDGESAYPIFSGPPPAVDFTDTVETIESIGAVFLPRDCSQFFLIPSASLRASGTRVEGTRRHRGNTFEGSYDRRYRLERSSQPFPPRWDDSPGSQEDDLQLPAQLSPAVARLALEHSQSGQSDVKKASQLEDFLQHNYSYGFGYPFSQSVDPVADFLLKKPAAHCELFATSLTLMLRTLHIPARYINGLVVQEQESEGSWVVRGHDAHAWVEAYLQGRWVTLDPTPPGAAGQTPPPDWTQRLRDWLAARWSKLTHGDYLELLKSLLEVGVAILGCAFLARRLRWRWRPRVRRLPERADELSSILEDFNKTLAGLGQRRPPQCTLAAWSSQLPEDHGRDFLDLYSRLRYGQGTVSPQEMAQLRELLRKLRGRIAKS